MSRAGRTAAAVLGLALTVACSTEPVIRQTGLTVSTRAGAAPPHDELGPVAASYCDHVLLLVFPIVRDQRDAYGRMLAQVRRMGGHALQDLRVRLHDTAWFLPFYFRGCWQIEATAIRYRD